MNLLPKYVTALSTALLFSASAAAAAFTFTTPTLPLPAVSGNGLTGQLWTNVNPNTDTLAQAQTIIAGGFATANFLATAVDYPSGPTGATWVGATYASVLDATAIATLDNPAVLPDDVLNTVMRFAGFFGVFALNEVWGFHIPSDDGSAVDIQGTRVLINDGIHGFGGPATTVEFTTPGLYALDILFFESQSSEWGLEFRGGLGGASPTTAITPRLYSLTQFADPNDPRLTSIRGDVPTPGTLPLLGMAFACLGLLARKTSARRNSAAKSGSQRNQGQTRISRPL